MKSKRAGENITGFQIGFHARFMSMCIAAYDLLNPPRIQLAQSRHLFPLD
ncbi:hypothetical protein ACVBGC_03275 [Burkholderia stagnalis]